MKFSLMTYTVAPQWPGGCQSLTAMADFAVELGFEALELSAGNLGETSVAEFGAICKDRGLAVSSINGGCTLSTPDDSEFQQGLDQGKYYADMAAELDCAVIMPLPGFADDLDDKPRAAERIAEGLRVLVDYAAERGVFVTLEDFPNALAPNASIAEVRWLMENVPGLRLTYDNGNWMIGGDDPLTALQLLGNYVINAHCKDWELDPDQSRMQLPDGRFIRGGKHGQGLIDHKPIFAELKKQGYGGYVAFEYEGPHDHQVATREGLAYLRGILAEVS